MSHVNVISSAANAIRVTLPNGEQRDIVVADSCHFGRNMQSVFKLLKELGCTYEHRNELGDRGQGFINYCGEYFNRADSYEIAKESGQPFNDDYTLPDIDGDGRKRLDSSCIRHFSKPIKEYIDG
ncbi:hypothetical protein [Vibrio phage PG216]|uniref:Uncharacterized protein n=1 Tax=Vibrio phage V09 TaxID=2724327 RepID=A0A6H0X9K3_9CAUD|nr:hypothetical protein COHAPHLL_00273 [Vibrio phage V09]WOL24837.1 hypothetical protein [Vibrio phage PG216]